ncbi:MAG: dUTP diphosphatase [Clostridiales bacterium]|nr:dUTP diphosphatase [Clostridiales bacterium]
MNQVPTIKVDVVLENNAKLPLYSTEGAAGGDLYAAISQPLVIPAEARALVPTGLRMAIPDGYELQIRPRSGLALKSGITVLNSPGTVDSDFRGVIGVILMNHSLEDFVVSPGDRIAQAVLAPFIRPNFNIVESLDNTERGGGGFGHTGK